MSEIVPTFHGELQLAGWSESHNSGCKVTFWLQSSEDLEAFRALTVRKGNQAGQRFMAALVEVGDDEQPVQQPEPLKPRGGPLAKLAGMLCADPEFWVFLTHQFSLEEAVEGPLMAAEHIRRLCAIESRAELDSDPEAEAMFHRAIRGPWIKWCAARGLK
jgi:hypothetical protein